MAELQEALTFIEKIERENSGKSAYEIANKLRGYTKKQYATLFWSTATGYKQEYIEGELQGKLNAQLALSIHETDFGHFIAALSDQINQPGVNWSDLTSWTGDHSSWAGDIGSAVIIYRSKYDNIEVKNLNEALDKFASDSDYTADIAAYVVGAMINSGRKASISKTIAQYDSISYSEHIKTFLKKRFAGVIEGNTLKNPANVEAEIRQAISTYIRLSRASDGFKSVKDLVRLQPKIELENTLVPNGTELLQGSLHFLSHMIHKGGLDSLRFKPYQIPGIPWLGTVEYDVTVSNSRRG